MGTLAKLTMADTFLLTVEGDVLISTEGDRVRVPPPVVVTPWHGHRWQVYVNPLEYQVVSRGEWWEQAIGKVDAVRRAAEGLRELEAAGAKA